MKNLAAPLVSAALALAAALPAMSQTRGDDNPADVSIYSKGNSTAVCISTPKAAVFYTGDFEPPTNYADMLKKVGIANTGGVSAVSANDTTLINHDGYLFISDKKEEVTIPPTGRPEAGDPQKRFHAWKILMKDICSGKPAWIQGYMRREPLDTKTLDAITNGQLNNDALQGIGNVRAELQIMFGSPARSSFFGPAPGKLKTDPR